MPRPIAQCLNKQLTTIYQRSADLVALDKQIKTYLKANLRDQCHVGNFNKGCLTLVVADPCAMELRYELPSLRDYLRNEAGLYQLISIDIKMVPELAQLPTRRKKHSGVSISNVAKRAIRDMAKQCDYAPLQDALNRLGSE